MPLRFPWIRTKPLPSFFFISHAKGGSTWIDGVVRSLGGDQVAPRFGSDWKQFRWEPGRIYSACFITREQFLSVPEIRDVPRFVVIRDLRDTLISRYYSMRDTHGRDAAGQIDKTREVLRSLPLAEGLVHQMDHGLQVAARIQQSWWGTGEPVYKYEELIFDDWPGLRSIFLDVLKLPVSESRLEKAVVSNRFETKFKRKLGEVDPKSHGRKGAPGDWKNYFTREIARQFQQRFGDVLIATGYEKDASWVEAAPEEHPGAGTQ